VETASRRPPYRRSSLFERAEAPFCVSQAGERRIDIVLDPSNDWRAIDPLHTWMASFRAVEQRVSLVRQTSNGLSAAYDPQGRVLAELDYYHTDDPVMVAHVPVQGVRTVYSRAPDAFAWLCLGALAVAEQRDGREAQPAGVKLLGHGRRVVPDDAVSDAGAGLGTGVGGNAVERHQDAVHGGVRRRRKQGRESIPDTCTPESTPDPFLSPQNTRYVSPPAVSRSTVPDTVPICRHHGQVMCCTSGFQHATFPQEQRKAPIDPHPGHPG
jgi:hypothetical protein